MASLPIEVTQDKMVNCAFCDRKTAPMKGGFSASGFFGDERIDVTVLLNNKDKAICRVCAGIWIMKPLVEWPE